MIPFPAMGFRTGGYPGWNPIDRTANVGLTSSSMVASCSANATFGEGVRSTVLKSSGSLYFEVTLGSAGDQIAVGVCTRSTLIASGAGSGAGGIIGRNAGTTYHAMAGAFGMVTNGGVSTIYMNSTLGAASGLGSLANGHVIAVAINFTSQLGWIKNLSVGGTAGQWNLNLNGDPAGGTNGISIAAILGAGLVPFGTVYFGTTGGIGTINPGTSSFTGTVPSGFTGAWK